MNKSLLTKIVSVVLILTMAVPAFAMASSDSMPEEIWGIFSERSTFKNMKAWYNEKPTEPLVSEMPS